MTEQDLDNLEWALKFLENYEGKKEKKDARRLREDQSEVPW